ncbi:MAG: hypothetical protein J1F67_09730 [Muribaculaceae bacterium]|nr:hypothetical protein [Muribaculaceae bacterium]
MVKKIILPLDVIEVQEGEALMVLGGLGSPSMGGNGCGCGCGNEFTKPNTPFA